MITRALEKYLRISPKKLNPITDLVRRKKVTEALSILINTNKKGARVLRSVVEAALNNAKRIPEKAFDEEELFISKLVIQMGPALKRYRAMSMGRAGLIKKRTSHVLVELDAPKKAPGKTAKAAKRERKTRKLTKAGKK